MKFCYLDESGMGSEPIFVLAGIVVDATRMHITKAAWNDLISLEDCRKQPEDVF